MFTLQEQRGNLGPGIENTSGQEPGNLHTRNTSDKSIDVVPSEDEFCPCIYLLNLGSHDSVYGSTETNTHECVVCGKLSVFLKLPATLDVIVVLSGFCTSSSVWTLRDADSLKIRIIPTLRRGAHCAGTVLGIVATPVPMFY